MTSSGHRMFQPAAAAGGNHRHRRRRDRARDDLLVERPEVFDRSAAAADDHDVDARDPADRTKRARNLAGGPVSLHTRRTDYQVGVRVAAPQYLDDVANR